ncbi:hypothetical protein AR679_gp109 [Yellowstone lake phycodnavirus 1]|jgi:hypothetical protein|uniref:hypothetical protein n=1 Tax=Yellowstone lake phycodnavirus 1 TaxID=1586713 RepID=UPI0006EB7F02|nr:hypothetical protein AR679_gp109 [Yellowstone lake phycodnavirus 1]BAT22135.1 hypothetical protein [Yellowstone lake phycodnavirus 1]
MSTRYLPTPLSDAFFSDFNRETIHGDIIQSIKSKTGYTINKQNDADLQALMKRVYVNLMADPYVDVRGQVANMNKRVVQEATQTISTGVLQQLMYIKDISQNPVPLAAPVSTSTYGNKIPDNTKFAF